MIRGIAILLLQAAALVGQAPQVNPRAQLEAGMAAAQAGKIDTAVKQFEAILRGNPPLEVAGQAHLELARIYQLRGDWWQAATQWEALRKLAPNEPEYAYQLGLAYRYLSKWAFERMNALAPRVGARAADARRATRGRGETGEGDRGVPASRGRRSKARRVAPCTGNDLHAVGQAG